MKFASKLLLLMVLSIIAGCGGEPSMEDKIKDKGEAIKKMGAKECMEDFVKAGGNGDVAAVWAHLPESYQKDINGLVHQFAGNMDKELWDKVFTVASKASKLLSEKQDFIIGSKMTATLSEKPDAKVLEAFSKIITPVVDSDLSDLEKVKTMDVGVFLAETIPGIKKQLEELERLKPEIKEVTKAMNSIKEAKVELVKEEGDVATFKLTIDGDTKEVKAFKVEGKWVPEDMKNDWSKEIAKAKKGLDEMATGDQLSKMKEQAMPMLEMVDGTLDKLLASESQEDFDKTIQGFMMSMMGGGPVGP